MEVPSRICGKMPVQWLLISEKTDRANPVTPCTCRDHIGGHVIVATLEAKSVPAAARISSTGQTTLLNDVPDGVPDFLP